MLALAHPRASTSSYLSSQFLANSRSDLHATSRSSHSRLSSFSLVLQKMKIFSFLRDILHMWGAHRTPKRK